MAGNGSPFEAATVHRLTSDKMMAYRRELEEAYRSGWLLSTANLANLLGLSRQTVASYGQHFEAAGFTFRRVGKRKGGQLAWQVGKPYQAETLPLD